MKKLLLGLIPLLFASAVAWGQTTTEPFNTFINSLSPATVPLGSSDKLPVVQGGVSKSVLGSQINTGGGGGSGSTVTSITRGLIPSMNMPSTGVFLLAGYRSIGDLGVGAPYTCAGTTSSSLGAIADSTGKFCALSPTDYVHIGWFGAFGDNLASSGEFITSGAITLNPQWRGNYNASAWVSNTTYGTGANVLGSDGIIYTSVVTGNFGNNPTTTNRTIGLQVNGDYNSTKWQGMTWDYVAAQEAAYAAFANKSVPGVVKWNTVQNAQNKNLRYFVPNGTFAISNRVTLNMQGGWVQFNGKLESIWSWYGGPDYMWYCDGCSYSYYENLNFVANNGPMSQNGGVDYNTGRHAVAAWDFSTNINSLNTQQNTLINLTCSVNAQGECLDWQPSTGSQGDTNTFINPVFIGNLSQYAINSHGFNSLNNALIGGDCQGFQRYCIFNNGGEWSIYNYHSEDQNSNQATTAPVMTQWTLYGASYYMNTQVAGSGPSIISAYRAEDNVPALAVSGSGPFCCNFNGLQIEGLQTTSFINDQLTWTSATSFQEGTVIAGGTDNRSFMLVDGGGTDWRTITNWTSSPTGATIIDSMASFTTNQWAGYNLFIRFQGNGFVQSCDIVSNTPTGITMDAACVPTNNGQADYQILGTTGGVIPTWNTAPIGAQAAFVNVGQGMATQAGSNCIQSGSVSLATNDYVAIPNAKTVGTTFTGGTQSFNGPQFPTIFTAKVTAVGSCNAGFGNVTVNRTPNVTIGGNGQAAGYGATPISDGSKGLKWIDFEWDSIGPANFMSGVLLSGGAVIQQGNGANGAFIANSVSNASAPTYNGVDCTNGLTSCGQTIPTTSASNFGTSFPSYAACLALGTGPSVNLLQPINNCGAIPYTPTQNATLTFPTMPLNNPQFFTIAYKSSGTTPFTTNFAGTVSSNGTFSTGNVSGVASNITFMWNGTTWTEIYRSTNANISISVGTATLSSNGVSVLAIGNGGVGNTSGYLNWGGEARSTAALGFNNNTLANISGLTVNVTSGRTYSIDAQLSFQDAAAAGIQVALTGTASATAINYDGWVTEATGATGGVKGYNQATSLGTAVASTLTSGTSGHVNLYGTFTVLTGGTLVLQAAQNTTNAGNPTTITRGARMLVHDMP